MFLIFFDRDETGWHHSRASNGGVSYMGDEMTDFPLFRIWITLSSVETCCPAEVRFRATCWVAIFCWDLWWISQTRMDFELLFNQLQEPTKSSWSITIAIWSIMDSPSGFDLWRDIVITICDIYIYNMWNQLWSYEDIYINLHKLDL